MEFLKKNIVSIAMFILTTVGLTVWGYIQKGAEVEFKEKVEAIITHKMQDKYFVQHFLDGEQIKSFTDKIGQEFRDKIVDDVTKSDSNKVSLRAYLGKELGIRDEQVLPLLSRFLNEYKQGKIPNKSQVDSIIKRRAVVPSF